ncbi:MAG: 50S ribosomal protein L10 [Planctomycetota bacterium]|nr:MAG: 50S ribosomal protein L10 [Planctomycetota bacterium]GDY07920.1 50S ribosomal protein L10 [Planctomycetia bacterium]
MSKAVKSLMMKDLSNQLQGAEDVVFVDISKLDGVSNNKLRAASRKQSIQILAAKFSLARRTLLNMGWKVDAVSGGPTTIVWGPDVVGLAKQAIKWAKEFPGTVVKGGYVGGQTVTPEEVKVLSESPSKEELISMIIGGLMSASTAALGAINAPGSNLASQIKQISEKEQAA